MPETLYLRLSGVPLAEQQAEFRAIRDTLSRAGLRCETTHEEAPSSSRADSALIADLAIGIFTSGSVATLTECIKFYLSKNNKAVVELRTGDQNATRFDGPRSDAIISDSIQSLMTDQRSADV